MEKGLVEMDPSIKILWTQKPVINGSAKSSGVMKTVLVNKALDSDDVPDEALDLVLLKHLVKIREYIIDDLELTEIIVDGIVEEFPGFERIAAWLEENGLPLRGPMSDSNPWAGAAREMPFLVGLAAQFPMGRVACVPRGSLHTSIRIFIYYQIPKVWS